MTTTRYLLLARIFIVSLGCMAIGWGAANLPIFWRQWSLEHIANRIIAGDPFQTETLTQQLRAHSDSASKCRAPAIRAAAIIHLRLLEAGSTGPNPAGRETEASSTEASIHRSLHCAPSDPFLWAVLFGLDNVRDGFRADSLKYLRMSYRLGPNEGWIALKRNFLALSVFQYLPEDLAGRTMDEFAGLVRSGYFDEAANLLTGPGWRFREVLVSRLADVPERRRQAFANALYAKGADVSVPGIKPPETRFMR